MIRRMYPSPQASRLLKDITGEPELKGDGLRRLFLNEPLLIVANRWVVGRGPVPDPKGNPLLRRSGQKGKVVMRPRVMTIPKGHPWRTLPVSTHTLAAVIWACGVITGVACTITAIGVTR